METLNNCLVNNSKEEFINTLKENKGIFLSEIDNEYAGGLYFVEFKYIFDEKQTHLDIDDFIHELCNLWELEAQKDEELGVRTCITRLGVVLGKNGGALEKMLPLFKLGLVGKIGSGKQFFSWIHTDDVIDAFIF